MVKLLLQPIGRIEGELLQWLAGELERRFPIQVKAMYTPWPLNADYVKAFNWARMQFNAVALNSFLYEVYRSFLKPRRSLVLGLVAGDGYVEGLNFVFGLAIPELSTATVYTARLESEDRAAYRLRLLKEAMHETGHLLGLNHCSNRRCVMSFSNSVREVDEKEPWFCPACTAKLASIARQEGSSLEAYKREAKQ